MANPKSGRAQRILSPADGVLFEMGDASDGSTGVWSMHFVPDPSFVGSIYIVGRARARGAATDNVAFVPIPYRRVSLGNVAQDYAIVSDAITGNAIIHIPASGMAVGFLATCSAGSAVVYNHPLEGASAP